MKFKLVFGLIVLLDASSSLACDIVNKHEIQVGVSTGVGGECSNNGQPIQCITDVDSTGTFSCDGPQGDFSGPDLQALIATTCGCEAPSQEGITEQLDQELDDS